MVEKKIRILYLIDNLRSGGKQRQLVELLKYVTKSKFTFCELAIFSKDVHYKTVHNLDLKNHFLIRRNKKDLSIFFKLFKICKKFKPDIIHSWGSMPSVYAVPIAKILNIKLINGMIRDAKRPKLFGKIYTRSKLTFPFSDLIVSNSNAGIKLYNSPVHKSICIYNGFDFDRIKELEDQELIRRFYGINTEGVVGMVATFSDYKDYDTYFSAAEIILKVRKDVTFLAVGDGKNLKRYKNLLDNRFNNKIKLLGKQENVESIINIFNIGVLSTNTDRHGEGISNSIIEYMALAKPVIATNCGGTNELVIDKKTGFLVNPKDPKELSFRIQQLLNDKQLAAKIGKEARKRIEKKFNLEKMSTSYISLYNRIMSNEKCKKFEKVYQ